MGIGTENIDTDDGLWKRKAYKPKAPNPTTNDAPTRPNQMQMHCKRISSR